MPAGQVEVDGWRRCRRRKPEWRVGLADARLRSDDPWLRVKSTRREAYDAARAALPAGLDEVIFLNERGEVCDGTITTVFFDRGAGDADAAPVLRPAAGGAAGRTGGCPEEVLLRRGPAAGAALGRQCVARADPGGMFLCAKVSRAGGSCRQAREPPAGIFANR